MKTLLLIVPVVMFLLFSSCRVGPTPDRIRTLETTEGITVRLTLTSSSFARYFELLAADGEGLYVRSLEPPGRNLYRIPYDRIERARFEGLRRLYFGRTKPDAVRIREVRLVSRFPQGMDDELRDALLRAYDQAAIETLE